VHGDFPLEFQGGILYPSFPIPISSSENSSAISPIIHPMILCSYQLTQALCSMLFRLFPQKEGISAILMGLLLVIPAKAGI
jgi:hypothetical protein